MLFRLLAIALIVAPTSAAYADTGHRIFVVREKGSADLLDGKFAFKLLKIRGYSITVRAQGADMVLKTGQSFSPAGDDCSVVFEEIATETRIARFSTDCR